MKFFSARGIFPWFTVSEGVVGFFMQCWLFSAKDEAGLLPRYHFASFVCFALLALTMAICWIGSRGEKDLRNDKLFFPHVPSAVGIALSAVGFGISAFSLPGFSFLRYLTPVCGLLAAVALLYIAYARFKGVSADSMLHCVITAFLVLRTMASCSQWTSEPQFQQYFFPLLACVFLMLASYYRAALSLGVEHSKEYVFFSQAALFCCCLCCRGSDWLFYLSAVLWLIFDCPAPSAVPKGRFLK